MHIMFCSRIAVAFDDVFYTSSYHWGLVIAYLLILSNNLIAIITDSVEVLDSVLFKSVDVSIV